MCSLLTGEGHRAFSLANMAEVSPIRVDQSPCVVSPLDLGKVPSPCWRTCCSANSVHCECTRQSVNRDRLCLLQYEQVPCGNMGSSLIRGGVDENANKGLCGEMHTPSVYVLFRNAAGIPSFCGPSDLRWCVSTRSRKVSPLTILLTRRLQNE